MIQPSIIKQLEQMSTSLKLLKCSVFWVLLEKWYMLNYKICLPGQVKSNINSHIKHGNLLWKNWTKVLTLLAVLWNNAATYIIWIVWDNYWLSQKLVARDTVHISFISKLFFRCLYYYVQVSEICVLYLMLWLHQTCHHDEWGLPI